MAFERLYAYAQMHYKEMKTFTMIILRFLLLEYDNVRCLAKSSEQRKPKVDNHPSHLTTQMLIVESF